jgi:hypothetical protein
MFIQGKTTFGVGEVLQELHRAAEEYCPRDEGPLWTLANPYQYLKSGSPALTSYAAQKVCHRLQVEQKAATDPHAGLHVFEPRKPGEGGVKLRISWDTYGATTLADVQAVLEKHQPLTFSYVLLLAHPQRHDEEKVEFRYRPPNVVRRMFFSQLTPPTHPRSRLRSSAKSTTRTIVMQSGYKFSMESYTTAAAHHIPSLATRAEWVLRPATTTSSRPLRS